MISTCSGPETPNRQPAATNISTAEAAGTAAAKTISKRLTAITAIKAAATGTAPQRSASSPASRLPTTIPAPATTIKYVIDDGAKPET